MSVAMWASIAICAINADDLGSQNLVGGPENGVHHFDKTDATGPTRDYRRSLGGDVSKLPILAAT